jgi:hypothetical protein
MKTKKYLSCLFFFLLSSMLHSQIEKVIVETYYISNQFDSTDTDGGKLDSGSVTYRVYVDLKPGNRLLRIYGDQYHTLKFSSTMPFFNNVDGESFGKDLKRNFYDDNTFSLDTWLTLGQTSRPLAGKTNFGILKNQDTDGSIIGGSNNDGGSAAIVGGLLTNSVAAMGLPLTVADGMDTMATVPTGWFSNGIKDVITGADTTMFGSLKVKSSFESNNAFLSNFGLRGVIADSNQILIAQLTTKGELAFEINLEVLEGNDTVRYVANDDTIVVNKKEKKNSFLKYPFPPPVCGCKDPNFVEYNPNFECESNAVSCLNRIIYGCMDVMACNYDPKANFSVRSLCCYPGSCGGREISVVCPSVLENSFDVNIYPNPALSSIFLTVTSGVDQEISYAIFNYFGTQVLGNSVAVNENGRLIDYEIDLSSLTNGLYLIRVKVGNEFVSKQFFKN